MLPDVGPMGLHADGVQFTKSVRAGLATSMFVIDWNIIHGSDKYRYKGFRITSIASSSMCDCGCAGYHSIQDTMHVFVGSMGMCRSGTASRSNHLKEPYKWGGETKTIVWPNSFNGPSPTKG